MNTIYALLARYPPAALPLPAYAASAPAEAFELYRLPFRGQLQVQSNWCWAAVAVSVAEFYEPQSRWTQAAVVGQELNRTDCGAVPVPPACDQPHRLDLALARTRTLAGWQAGVLGWEAIRQELLRRAVLGVRVAWRGGGGHFVAIYGVARSLAVEYLLVDDPLHGPQTIEYQQFISNYQGSGQCSHLYFTHAPMFLTLESLDPALFQPILAARALPLAEVAAPASSPAAPQLGLPHYVHVVPLAALLAEPTPTDLFGPPTGIRALEVPAGSPPALYEVATNPQHPGLLAQVSSPAYLALLDEGLARLQSLATPPGAELRLVRIPALNTEALWLAGSAAGPEYFYPLPRFTAGPFEDRVYTRPEFVSQAQAAARQLSAATDDLLGGT
jgi:hypothetical protein